MNIVINLVRIGLVAACLATLPAMARPTRTNDVTAKTERVAGDYVVASIKRTSDQAFRIEFSSATPGQKFKTILLESDHVHVAVQQGQKLRLSAEVLSAKGDTAEASQVVLFLPNVRGTMPVWLLSRKGDHSDLRAARYIDMHAPLSDYQIL